MENEYLDNVIYNFIPVCGTGAHLYALKGDKKRAESLLELGWKLAKNNVDSVYMRYYHTRYLQANRKYIESYKMYSQALFSHNAILFQYINNPVSAVESKYFEQKAILSEQKAKKQKYIYVTLFILIVAIISSIAICLNIRRRRELLRKNIQINQYMDVVNTLQKEIDSRDSKIQQITDDSLKDRCETINQLCRTYFETTHSKRQQTIIFNEVKTLVENLSSDAYLETVERCVNQYCDNLLVQLKQDMPELSHNEYKLACFVCIGFSTQVMCLVFECTPEILYRRVYRLRDKIRHCPSEHKAKYLKYI